MSWELSEMSSSIKLLFHAILGKHITLKNVKWQQCRYEQDNHMMMYRRDNTDKFLFQQSFLVPC